MTGYAAIVLAGGAARRMGGVDKPARAVGGRSMLHRVLGAVADADQRIVVGSSGPAPEGVRTTREEPPGGGPVAATAAGLALLDPGTTTVAVLAADLPLLTTAAVAGLRRALAAPTAGPDDGSRNASA
ncbi:molybdenum cofactor guanylyltransferase, partial [Micromonospora marina]|uniref:molybdenum cofactor guanylyltransferase n=1 Tax=Micromonospora marina TaxID=307120 RepID=UPI003455BA3B